jgi:steroid 5-alpha reductase family enzyme
METTTILAINFTAVLAMMLTGWLISLIRRNVTIVDSLWGLGFVLIAWLTFLLGDGFTGRKLLIAVLVSIWGLRLSLHLSVRNWGKGEDPRYGNWRKQSGERFWLVSLFKVFILQAVFLWAIALALQWGQLSPRPAGFTVFDYLGLTLWVIGMFFEAVGDWQLARFKGNPANKGRVMDQGLWAYSRHPNYFGESLLWWGVFLITLSTPAGFWTIVSPVIITLVLLKMTGVPIMEKAIVHTRPGYREYIERTNAFIPWFPKKGSLHKS